MSLPAQCDAALLALGAHGLHGVGAAVTGPVSTERQPLLDSGIAPAQLFARRSAVGIGFRLVDEVLLPEAPTGFRARGQRLGDNRRDPGSLAGHNFLAGEAATIGENG